MPRVRRGPTGAAAPEPVVASLTAVRRLAVARQRLAGPRPRRPGPEEILGVIRDLGYVQWDPVEVVAPSHLLSLWARLGAFRRDDLERLLWRDRTVFEHWLPFAALVLTEDYPLYRSLMARYPESYTGSWGTQRSSAREFLATHRALARAMLRALRSGPKRVGDFAEHPSRRRAGADWAPSSDVAEMLFHLHMRGDVMVVGHDGPRNLWGLTDDFLPSSVDRRALSAAEFEKAAAVRALRALGTASPREITLYFVRGRYERLSAALADLAAEGTVHRVRVPELGPRDERYVHRDDLPELMQDGPVPSPRVALLPPFDNFVSSPARTERLFGFTYVREQFLAPERRRYGTYVLPILWGDRLIGRIDPQFVKPEHRLEIHAVHAEPGAPADRQVADGIRSAIEELAAFVGAEHVRFGPKIARPWRAAMR